MDYNYLKVRDYEENEIDVSEPGNHYVLSFFQNVHIKVSEQAKIIIEKFNGKRTIEEIIEELKKDNIELSEEDLIEFIKDCLIRNSLIEDGRDVVIKDESKLWFHFPLINGKKLRRLIMPFTFLFKRASVLAVMILLIVQQIYLVWQGAYSGIGSINVYNMNSLGILAIVFFSFLIHEMGHAAAALYYKITVGDMGIGLYLLKPVFFTDLSNAWKLDRKKRVATDLGGIYFQALFVLVISTVYAFYKTDTLKIAILLVIASIIGNVNPVLRYDGYWIITDMLGIVNVDRRAFEFLKSNLASLFLKRKLDLRLKIKLNKGLERIFYLYIILYLLFTIGAVALGFFLLIKLMVYPQILVETFRLLADSIKKGSIPIILSRINSSLLVLLPAIFFILMLRSSLRNFFKPALIRRLRLKGEQKRNPFLLLAIPVYTVSFIFAKESKVELAALLCMTLVLFLVMSVVKKDEEPAIRIGNSTLELAAFLGYFALYMMWSFLNIFYGFVKADFTNILLLFFLPCLIIKFFGHNLLSAGLDFKKFFEFFPKTMLLCVIISAFLVPVLFMQSSEQEGINILNGSLSFLFAFVTVFILTAVPEEFFFRSILQQRLEVMLKNPVTAVLLSSAIFAFFHIPYRLFISTSLTYSNFLATVFSVVCQQFLLGAFLGMWWQKTRNTFSTAFIHSFYNAFLLLGVVNIGTK